MTRSAWEVFYKFLQVFIGSAEHLQPSLISWTLLRLSWGCLGIVQHFFRICQNFLEVAFQTKSFGILEDNVADVGVINTNEAKGLGLKISKCYQKFRTANPRGSGIEIIGIAKGRIQAISGVF